MRDSPREQDPTWDTSRGFCSNLLKDQERIFTVTLSLPDVSQKRQWNPPSLDVNERDRRDDGTVLPSLLGRHSWLERCQRLTARKQSKSTISCRRSCVRRFNPKRRSIPHVTKAECCENIFLRWAGVTGREYCRLNLKKYMSRGGWNRRTRRTTKTGQHDNCENGKSGSSSDSTVTWDIHSQQS